MSDDIDHRCLAMAQVSPGTWKRCVRATEHPESHIWAEALNVSGRAPVMVRWNASREAAPAIFEVYPVPYTQAEGSGP